MRTMLLSFKADVFERVKNGEKIYEHRRNFPDEPITAYLYVGKPIQAIVGMMHLKNRTNIDTWLVKYSYDKKAIKRIEAYLHNYRYAMEIYEYQHTNMISLEKLKQNNLNFNIPYMYCYLDGKPLLNYLEENLHPEGELIHHVFENITSDQICNS